MKVFISRNLDKNSPFKHKLEEEGHTVTGISLLSFIPIPFSPLPEVDWLFFYSKNGVKHFFDQITYNFGEDMNMAAMGMGTAKTIKKYGYPVAFTGKGTPTEIATAFGKKVTGQQVAFLRAFHSKKTVQSKLEQKITVIDRVVYRNIPITNCLLPPYQVLVFTSPVNAQTYFKYNTIYSNQPIFSIGESTTSMLHYLGVKKINTASNPSELALANAILRHLKRNS